MSEVSTLSAPTRTAAKPRKKIVWVGSFEAPPDGSTGGQLFACQSLVESPLGEIVDWEYVDTTMRSYPPPGVHVRAIDAARRIGREHVEDARQQSRRVSSSSRASRPTSLAEKGTQCIIARMLGKRVVWNIQFGPYQPRRLRALHRQFVKLVGRCCDIIQCQSADAAHKMETIFEVDPSKTVVISNWIKSEQFAVPPAGHTPQRGSSPPRLIYVGWLHPKKGVTYLLKAIKLLKDRGVKFTLDICGSGDLDAELKAEANQLAIEDYVNFRGWVMADDLKKGLHDSDIFVLPSLGEGLPNAMMQAMAAGLPIIVSRVDSVPGVIKQGINGYLAEPGDPESLAEAIEALVGDEKLRREIGENNAETIRRNHDIRAVWPRVAECLEVEVEDSLLPEEV